MTKQKRIIPCLDIREGRVVKGVRFTDIKDAGDPMETALAYDKAGADELIFLDITGYLKRNDILDTIKKTVKEISIPLTVGGGIKTVEGMENALKAGASKVSFCSPALQRPDLINEGASAFGGEKIVIAIDAKKREGGPGWDAYINGGRVNTGIDVLKWALEAQNRGAGEILLTSMDKDGTKSGYDIELMKEITKRIDIPVIASGGAGEKEHFFEVLTGGGASGALAASLFHFRELEIPDLKNYLFSRGVDVRIIS